MFKNSYCEGNKCILSSYVIHLKEHFLAFYQFPQNYKEIVSDFPVK